MDLLDLNTIQTMIIFGSGLIIGVIFGMMILSCISIGKELKWGIRDLVEDDISQTGNLIWEEDLNREQNE